MVNSLIDAIGGATFDWVFTHSRDRFGEYGGHANHSEMVSLVTASRGVATDDRHGQCRPLLLLSDIRLRRAGAVARPDATHYLQLTYDELLFKCHWTMQAPDVDPASEPCVSLPEPRSL